MTKSFRLKLTSPQLLVYKYNAKIHCFILRRYR